jgi:hypothetical protein
MENKQKHQEQNPESKRDPQSNKVETPPLSEKAKNAIKQFGKIRDALIVLPRQPGPQDLGRPDRRNDIQGVDDSLVNQMLPKGV